jgi:hypothetical protein
MSFQDLTPQNQRDFVAALPVLLTNREEIYPGFRQYGYSVGYHSPSLTEGDTEADDDDVEDEISDEDVIADLDSEDCGYSYHQVSNRLRVLSFIHGQRKLIKKRGIPMFNKPPFDGEAYGTVASRITPYVINRLPAVPEAVALPLLSAVLDWVDRIGPTLAAAHQRYQCAIWGNDKRLMKMAMREIDSLGFDYATLSKLPWKERPAVPGSDEPNLSDSHRVRLSALMYRDACVLALQYLVGPRVSEICSAIVSRQKKKGLPSCVYKRESPDGHFDIYFLKGKIKKGLPRPVDHDWAVGLAPRGAKHLPLVVRAVTHLHTMWAALNPDTEEYSLFQNFSNRKAMPLDLRHVVPATGMALQRGIRRFVRCFVDLSGLPDFDDFGNDLRPYRDSRGQCIRNHQGRKTFAEYALRTRDSALEALSDHYGHFNTVITYKGYYEPIQRQASELDDMQLSATVNFFVSRAHGKKVFGNMAKQIDSFVSDNGLGDIKDIGVLRDKIKDLVVVHDIRIFFGSHGACFISASPLKSRCRQSGGQVSFLFRTPDYESRSIEMCCGCDCLAVDASNLHYYEKRMETNRVAAGDPTNRTAVARFQTSARIVKAIKSQIGG